MLRMSIDLMKENRFKVAKERSRRYPAQTIMDVDYIDDIALLLTDKIKQFFPSSSHVDTAIWMHHTDVN